MDARPLAICIPALIAIAIGATGCGSTEKSGQVGATPSAKGLQATVEQVDTRVPVPESDVTGLSQPAQGSKLVGAQVRVCSDHGDAIGPTTSVSQPARATTRRRSTRNKPTTTRSRPCATAAATAGSCSRSRRPRPPDRVTFGFEDTGTSQHPETQVNAKFSWTLSE